MTAVPPLPSGLPDVDRQWGGFAAGRAYLLVGRAGAGRSALALQTARAAVDDGQRCVVLSPRAPAELVDEGRRVGLDLAAAHAAGQLRLLRIPDAAALVARGPDGLATSYRDLGALVAAARPTRVVVEDFTPLVQFDTFEGFQDAFSALVDAVRAAPTTLVVGLGDPANDASRQLLAVVEGLVDGTIRVGAGGDLVLGLPGPVAYPSSDGASVDAEPRAVEPDAADPAAVHPPDVEADAPEAGAPDATVRELAPPAEPVADVDADPPHPLVPAFPTPDAFALDPGPAPREERGAHGHGAPPAVVVPPPAPDPALLAPTGDPFGYEPADALFEEGYLADSAGGEVVGQVPPPALPEPPAVPSFTPLGAAPAPDPGIAFRTALDASFEGRDAGTGPPFVVAALRMDPAAPQAAHFGAVEAGLRSALRPADRLLVDAPRKRAAAVLPRSGPDDAQALFGELQAHLRAALGAEAEGVLQAVAAVTVPDGQPFETSADLVRYAFEG